LKKEILVALPVGESASFLTKLQSILIPETIVYVEISKEQEVILLSISNSLM